MSTVPVHFAAPQFSAASHRLDLDTFELLHHYNGVQLEPSWLKFEYSHDVIVVRKGENTHMARFNCVSAPHPDPRRHRRHPHRPERDQPDRRRRRRLPVPRRTRRGD